VSQAEEFQDALKQLAAQLFANLEDPDPQSGLLADGIAFTVFSDLKKLTRTSSFGRYLSEQLMTEFQQQGFLVVEVRKSNAIMVMEKRGEYGLSRNLEEIRSAAPARTMLTGTYTVAGDHIMVNAKILDNKNSAMLSSATVLFAKNRLTTALLSDAASAYAKKDAYVYMKKLEL
jgi:TolB-like protein